MKWLYLGTGGNCEVGPNERYPTRVRIAYMLMRIIHFKYHILLYTLREQLSLCILSVGGGEGGGRGACHFHARRNARATAILLTYYVFLLVCAKRYAGHVVVKSTNRNYEMPRESSEDVMDCRCEKTWQRQAAIARHICSDVR